MNRYIAATWDVLVNGFFAMIPGLLFAAIPAFFIVAFNAEDRIPMEVAILYGGSCGGYWVAKKILAIKIQKLTEQANKSDVLDLLK
jgi:hypothetical protein